MAKQTYEKPAVTADCVILRREAGTYQLQVLLIQRAKEPFAGRWALPGGFVNKDEPLGKAASRELREETGLRVTKLGQVGAFGDPGRDPRGWTISIAFLAEVSGTKHKAKAADDAKAVNWFPVDALPPLAFDHRKILKQALASHSTDASNGR